MTAVKLLPSRMLIAAGKTMIAEINNAPAMGIMTAIAIPVKILKHIDINRTGSPSTSAVSSSNVNTYIGRLKKKNNKTMIPNKIPKKYNCSVVIVTMEPNKYDCTLSDELPPFKFIKTNANAKPPAIKMAMDISEYVR